ncbi:unnamed protein product [Callosobruchus maculatus]|uniref:Chitin-binding type-2 domain-containing protein n=1 Tax=Callosobruchus maculatus TaxID=64391 RepID=A0A653C3C5_CALMS|nr:unnamed protein product [Callosobruchus maculatus]
MKAVLVAVSLLAIFISVKAVPSCPEKDPAVPVYYPHDVYCYKFYECSDGHAYELECAPPLNWDQAKTTCDDQVDCGKLKPRA